MRVIGDENAFIRGYKIKGYQVVPGFQIIGVTGSEAEAYAREQNIPFAKELDNSFHSFA